MPKRKLKPRPKLADDDVCKKHQPTYKCRLSEISPEPKPEPKPEKEPKRESKSKPKLEPTPIKKIPSLLEIIADKDCACELIARSVGVSGVHHHIGLSDLRESINKNAHSSSEEEHPKGEN